MLNVANSNKTNATPSTQPEKRKYGWYAAWLSLKTLFAFLYLKTIGLMLYIIFPQRWSQICNQWAKNILSKAAQALNSGKQTNDLVNAEGTIEGLKSQVEGLQTKLTQKDAEIEKLKTAKSTLEEKIKESEADHKKAQEEVGRLTEKLEGVSQALTTFSNLCAKQVEQLESLKIENKELKSIILELAAKYKELSEISKNQMEDFAAKFNAQSTRISELNGKVILCSINFAKQLDEFKKKVEEKGMEISRLTTLNEQLEQDKKAAKTKDSDYKQATSEKDERIKKLEEQLRESEKESNEQSMTIQSLTDNNKNISNKLEEAQKEAETKEDEYNLTISEKDREIERLKNLLTEKGNTIQSITADNKNIHKIVKKEIVDVRQQNENLREQVTELEEQVELLKKEKDQELLKAQSALETQKSQLGEQNKTHEENISQLKKELGNLNSELEIVQKEKKDLEEVVSELRKKVKDLEKNKESVENLTNGHQKTSKALIYKNEELEKSKVSLSIENKDLKAKLSSEKDEVSRQKKIVSERDKSLQKATHELAEQKALVEQLQIEALTKEEVAKLKGQVKFGEDTVELLKTEERKLRESIQVLEEKQQKLQNETLKPQEEKEAPKVQDPDTASISSKGSTAGSDTPYESKSFVVDYIFHGPCTSKQAAILNIIQSGNNAIFGTKFYQFLSELNKELKKDFPELQKQHFCHRVFEKAIISLLDENNGRFKISRLDKLLISSFSNIIKEILTSKVREIVNEHNSKLLGCVTSAKILEEKKLLHSITECMKDLGYKIQVAGTIKDSVLSDFKKPENSITPLSDIIINVLAQCREKSIVNKANTLELVSKMSNEFLLRNVQICPRVSVDEYKFNYELISKRYGGVNNKEIGTPPNTSISRINSTQSLTPSIKTTSSTSIGRTNNPNYGLANKESVGNRRLFGF